MKTPSADFKENILQTIGNTPLVRINKLNPNKNTTIYAKVEGFNPTGSIKDRIALSMIQQAEDEGTLTKNKTIIEPTSGNTGVALAMIGAIKGYEVEIVMSEYRLGRETTDDQSVRRNRHLKRGEIRHRRRH